MNTKALWLMTLPAAACLFLKSSSLSPALGVATASIICHASVIMVHTLPSAQLYSDTCRGVWRRVMQVAGDDDDVERVQGVGHMRR